MTLAGAMNNAVLGLNAESANLGAIADNIANSQTVGYKTSVTRFENLVGGPDISPSRYIEAGVKVMPQTLIARQGVLQTQSSNTALAISGNGFFPVTSAVDSTSNSIAANATTGVTRAGDFTVNKNGYLVNAAGFYLLGVPTGPDGGAATAMPAELDKLSPVKVGVAATTPGKATTRIGVIANLPASDPAGGSGYSSGIDIYDHAGNPYNLSLKFTKTATNEWQLSDASVTSNNQTGEPPKTTVTPTKLSFDGQGKLTSPASAISPVTITLPGGETITPSLFFNNEKEGGKLTQQDDTFSTAATSQDGYAQGAAGDVSYDAKTGILKQNYSNNSSIPIATLPVITYRNPYGLEAHTGNLYTETPHSGTINIDLPDTQGAGKIDGNRLESSTTDLSTEFSHLIVSQNNYAANSKVVKVADDMMAIAYRLKTV